MGIRNALKLTAAATAATRAPRGWTTRPKDPLSRASLLTSADLSADAAAAFGINADTITISRQDAMTIPAMKRGRGVICGVISSLPLVLLDSAGVRITKDAPAWLGQPDPNVPLAGLLTWTVDDMLFHGVSWWRVTARYSTGWPSAFERLTPDRVMVIYTGRTAEVYVDGRPADDRDLIRFDGPDEGILRNGGRALKTAIALENATRRLAKLDVPLGYLTPEDSAAELSTEEGSAGLIDETTGEPTADSEVDVLLDTWEDARATRNTAFLNRAVKYVTVQFDAHKIQLTEQRQAQAVEVARLLNLDPRYVAAPTGDSTTYATSEGNRRELLDISLAPFINPIEQRLSMRDVTPNGQRIRLARAAWMRGDLLQVLQAAKLAHEIGAITTDEIRTEYLGLPPREGNPE